MTDHPPTIEERYLSATNTSNLRVEAERTGSADVLIAYGWSMSRVGSALLRLQSEWDSSAKSIPPPIEAVAALAQTMRKPGKKIDMRAAQKEADRWFDNELAIFRLKLKNLTPVLTQTVGYMERKGIEYPLEKAGPIVGWWLNKNCPECKGLGRPKILDAPILGKLACPRCHGSGEVHIPYGDDGRRVVAWLDDCLNYGRQATRARLRNY